MKKVIINIGNRLEKRRRINKLDIVRGGSCSCQDIDPGCGYSTRSRSELSCGSNYGGSIGCGISTRSSSNSSCGYGSSSRC